MNRKQRVCLTVGFILSVAAALFPPWRISGGRRFADSSSYGFLFSPPGGTLELGRLLVEWALIILVTAGFFLLLRKMHDLAQKPESSSLSRTKWWLLVFFVIVPSAAALGLGFYSYATRKKLTRLEAGIRNAKTIVDSELSSWQVMWVSPVLPKPVGKLRPIPQEQQGPPLAAEENPIAPRLIPDSCEEVLSKNQRYTQALNNQNREALNKIKSELVTQN